MEEFVIQISLIYMEDALNLIIQHSANLIGNLVNFRGQRRRSSIVRKIGSYITWIKPKRVQIIFGENSSSENNNLNIDCQCEETYIDVSNQDKVLGTKVEELMIKLVHLQSKVDKILLNQEKNLLSCDESFEKKEVGFNSVKNAVSSSSSMVPPPPPPLPTTPIQKTQRIKSKKQNYLMENIPACSIIEELANRPPKLRHVDRTPGGKPVRNVPVENTHNVLRAVLKKRYEALHSP